MVDRLPTPNPNPDGRGTAQPIFLLGDVGQLRRRDEQVVTRGKVVAIYYMLKVNGILRHGRSPLWNDPPLEYLHGSGQVIPGLEKALEGRRVGESFKVVLPPEEAYGPRRRELQQKVPIDDLRAALGLKKIEEGLVFQGRTEDGRVETFMVTEVLEDEGMALVDANHPLAGMELVFEVDVVGIREPTEEEARRGFVAPHPAGSGTHGRRGWVHRPGADLSDRDELHDFEDWEEGH